MSSSVRDAGQRSGVAPEFTVDPAILDAISPSAIAAGLCWAPACRTNR
jgi:hypothetical protein